MNDQIDKPKLSGETPGNAPGFSPDPHSSGAFTAPKGWEIIHPWGDGYALRQVQGGLRVIVDCEVKADGRRWIHVSCSRKAWTPTHEDMAVVKRDFIGDDRYAYAIWPPRQSYVNIHSHCLHLWACMEDDGQLLPEFSAIIEGIGRSV